MKLSIDGGNTFIELPEGTRIVVEDVKGSGKQAGHTYTVAFEDFEIFVRPDRETYGTRAIVIDCDSMIKACL